MLLAKQVRAADDARTSSTGPPSASDLKRRATEHGVAGDLAGCTAVAGLQCSDVPHESRRHLPAADDHPARWRACPRVAFGLGASSGSVSRTGHIDDANGWMSSVGVCGHFASESVDGIRRNEWTKCIGISSHSAVGGDGKRATQTGPCQAGCEGRPPCGSSVSGGLPGAARPRRSRKLPLWRGNAVPSRSAAPYAPLYGSAPAVSRHREC